MSADINKPEAQGKPKSRTDILNYENDSLIIIQNLTATKSKITHHYSSKNK